MLPSMLPLLPRLTMTASLPTSLRSAPSSGLGVRGECGQHTAASLGFFPLRCRGLSTPHGGALLGHLLLHWPRGVVPLHVSHTSSPLTARQGFALPCPDSPQAPPWQLQGWAMPCGGAVGAGWNHPCPAWVSPGHPSQRNPPQPPDRPRAPAPGAHFKKKQKTL